MQILVVVWSTVSRDTHRNWVIVYIIRMERRHVIRTEIKRKACRGKHYPPGTQSAKIQSQAFIMQPPGNFDVFETFDSYIVQKAKKVLFTKYLKINWLYTQYTLLHCRLISASYHKTDSNEDNTIIINIGREAHSI